MRLGTTLLGAATCALLITGAALADDGEDRLQLITTIAVPGGLTGFDISFVDPVLDLYVLADRTNAAVDFFDTRTSTFIDRVGGKGVFAGIVRDGKGNPINDLSGPDGVVVVDHREVWAGDGNSTVKVIDLKSRKIVATISTGGTARVDEMSYDSRDHILAVANNADSPPFLTLIDTNSRKILKKITFPDATNGLEQSQWSPKTGLFYVSVPQIGPNAEDGGVAVIDPKTLAVTKTFPVKFCQPAGLTLGPDKHALVGCSASTDFTVSGKLVPPVTVVINVANGKVVRTFTQVVGNDEVWFNPGDDRYYLAARNNPVTNGGASLGVIDAEDNEIIENVPTSISAHSVAADPLTNHIFVPIGAATKTQPNNICPVGCIAVFGHGERGEELKDSRKEARRG
jgi:hypothetical protein